MPKMRLRMVDINLKRAFDRRICGGYDYDWLGGYT